MSWKSEDNQSYYGLWKKWMFVHSLCHKDLSSQNNEWKEQRASPPCKCPDISVDQRVGLTWPCLQNDKIECSLERLCSNGGNVCFMRTYGQARTGCRLMMQCNTVSAQWDVRAYMCTWQHTFCTFIIRNNK